MIDLYKEDSEQQKLGASLKIIGVGGAGGNAVNSMISSSDMEVASFMIANTDAQALSLSPAETKIQLGAKVTKGLGAGSNPEVGRRAAEEDLDEILQKIEGSDILFLTGGLGGGTGSGAVPVIANAARELGVLTVAIVTKPFMFEGRRRARIAEEAIKNLRTAVDTLIVVPNQRLLEIVDDKISMLDAFALSNDILKQAIKGISDIITKSGHINVDFADVRAIMKDMGMALMGTGKASGEKRAQEAAKKAISSPLLENISIEGAKGVLINITGNTDLGLYEINEAASLVYDLVSEDANIILGSVIDPDMGEEVMVTVIATGFESIDQASTDKKVESEYIERVARDHAAQIKQEVDQRIHEIHGARKEAATVNQVSEPVKVVEEPAKPIHVEKVSAPLPEPEPKKEAAKQEIPVDLNDLDTPTFLRKKVEQAQAAASNSVRVEEVPSPVANVQGFSKQPAGETVPQVAKEELHQEQVQPQNNQSPDNNQQQNAQSQNNQNHENNQQFYSRKKNRKKNRQMYHQKSDSF